MERRFTFQEWVHPKNVNFFKERFKMKPKDKQREFDPKEASKEHDSRLEKKRTVRQETRKYNSNKMNEFFSSNGTFTVNSSR